MARQRDKPHKPVTWHYGLVAEWWAEATARPEELAYYERALRRYGEPALDLACGTGRILVPMLERGFDVDGIDVSEDMLVHCRRRAQAAGVVPNLLRQPMHELRPRRRYRTVYICDSFGIGGDRRRDFDALCRIREVLEDGGVLLISHDLPYADAGAWARWLPERRRDLPESWPDASERAPNASGSQIRLRTRLEALDPLRQRITLAIEGVRWLGSRITEREEREIDIALYFAPELTELLERAGFAGVTTEGYYTGRPATADDTSIVVIARRES